MTRVCLSSLARWTRTPCELVVVDNGSRDGTAHWLRSFGRRLASSPLRLRVIRNEANRGYPAAMNQGLEAARGQWLVLGSADAAVTAGWLEGMQEAFLSRKRIGGVSSCSNPPLHVPPKDPWSAPPWYAGVKQLERFAAAAALGAPRPVFEPAEGFVPGFWLLTRREVLERVGPFDESFHPGGFADWELQCRMREAGFSLGFSSRVYVHHVWFGCARANGLRPQPFFGEKMRRRLNAKHPAAAGATMRTRTYFG